MSRNYPINIRNRNILKTSQNKLITPANFNSVRKYIGPLPANTNPRWFQFTLGILTDKSKIGLAFRMMTLREKTLFIAYPSQRGLFIYNLLKRLKI